MFEVKTETLTKLLNIDLILTDGRVNVSLKYLKPQTGAVMPHCNMSNILVSDPIPCQCYFFIILMDLIH